MVPLTMAWMAELISDNAEQRAFTAAAMNTLQCQYSNPQYTFSTNRFADTFMAWIPLVWFQQVHQPYVTPGNRAAAVIAGVNIIIFTTIAFLAHKDKLARKRKNVVSKTDSSEPQTPIDESNEKRDLNVGVLAVQPQAVEAAGRPA